MAFSNNVVSLCLLSLSSIGFYLTWGLFMKNGSADLMTHIRDFGPPLLPGTREPLKLVYTGIARVDYQLTVLSLFFWELVDGSAPHASLFCFYLAGQFAAGWGLLLIEGLRHSNRWRIVSFLTIWGIVMQNITFAVVMPIYLAIHLFTSPTATSCNPDDYVVDKSELASIPFSVFTGFVIPAVLLSLPAPLILTFDQKQIFMAIWQIFPVSVAALQQVLPLIMFKFLAATDKPAALGKDFGLQWFSIMRVVYVFLLIIAGTVHISTMALLAASELFPGLWLSEHIFNPMRVFLPISMSPSTKMPSIGSGALLLLQYDCVIGSTAMVIWASVLLANNYTNGKSFSRYLTMACRAIVQILILGPIGYAVACVWSRDESIFAKAAVDFQKYD